MRKTAIILAIGSIAVVAAGYVAWRQAGQTAMEGLRQAQTDLAAQSVMLDWDSAGLAGFPFDIHLALEGPSVETAQGWRMAAAWAQARAAGDGVRLIFAPEATLDAGAGPMAAQVVDATAFLPEDGGPSARVEAMTLTGVGGGRLSFSGLSLTSDPQPQMSVASARLTTPQGGLELFATTLTMTPEVDANLTLVQTAQRVEVRNGGETVVGAGPSTLRLGAVNGRAAARLNAERVRLSPALAPAVQPLEAARVEIALDAPVDAAATLQPYTVTLDANAVTLGPDFLQAIAGVADTGPMSVSAALSGEAMVRRDLLSGETETAAQLPVRIATLAFDRLAAQGLGAEMTLSGVLVLKPDRSAPDGELLVQVANWAPALAALQRGGVVTPDQAAFAVRLVDRLADPSAAPGVFLSRIALRGAEVYANGVRVR